MSKVCHVREEREKRQREERRGNQDGGIGIARLTNCLIAFFTFLRANLVLSPSAMSSCANTPLLEPTTTTTGDRNARQAPPSPTLSASSSSSSSSVSSGTAPPSPLLAEPLPADDDIPDLVLEPLTSADDKREALHLVADSIAEMQPRAARALVLHPACLSGLAAAAALARALTRGSGAHLLFLACGLVAVYLLAARWLASGYVRLAESTDWASWLRSGPDAAAANANAAAGQQDTIIGARYKGALVGALVLRVQPNPAKRSRARNLRGGRGVIRAWTTKLRYRGTGVGAALLAEALRLTKEKCGRDAEVGFAKEHANSTMLLPRLFSGGFRRDEVRATRALSRAVGEWEATRRKR